MHISPETLPRITPNTALFLDFDGTLVELAAQPELVEIPPGLTATLSALREQLHDALALVSGRALVDLDGFLSPLLLPAAGEHGAQRRTSSGHMVSAPPADMQGIVQAAQALIRRHPDLRLELKSRALSLHYRHAPELESLCLQVMREALGAGTGAGFELMQGKLVIDIKPLGYSKGTAIAAFMAEAPFVGRVPLFVGDDTTDEAGFEEVQRLGGHAVKVGPGPTLARYRCASVGQLAAWLQHSASAATDRSLTGHAA